MMNKNEAIKKLVENDNNFLLKLPSAFCSNPDFKLRKVNRYL